MDFVDHFGEKCSLQKSSLADEDAIWFGIDTPKIMQEGYDPEYPARCREWPEEEQKAHHVSVLGRMHLTQEQVRELLPLLQHFAESGELP